MAMETDARISYLHSSHATCAKLYKQFHFLDWLQSIKARHSIVSPKQAWQPPNDSDSVIYNVTFCMCSSPVLPLESTTAFRFSRLSPFPYASSLPDSATCSSKNSAKDLCPSLPCMYSFCLSARQVESQSSRASSFKE